MKVKKKSKGTSFRDASEDDEFVYQPRTTEDWDSRTNQSGGSWDPMVKDGVKNFKPKDGDNRIRVLPPGWRPAKGYAWEVFQHSEVGPDRQRYLCPEKAGKGRCPICEERLRIEPTADPNDKAMKVVLFKLRPVKRNAFLLIDRNNQSQGPLLWIAPWKVEAGMNAAAKDRETGKYTAFDNPDDGCDVFFGKTGSQDRTEYGNYSLSKNPGPIVDDPKLQKSWLSWVKQHPIPDILVYHSFEKINKAFKGLSKKEEAEEAQTRSKPRDTGDDLDDPLGEDEPGPEVRKIKKKKKLKLKSKDGIKKKKKKLKSKHRDEDE